MWDFERKFQKMYKNFNELLNFFVWIDCNDFVGHKSTIIDLITLKIWWGLPHPFKSYRYQNDFDPIFSVFFGLFFRNNFFSDGLRHTPYIYLESPCKWPPYNTYTTGLPLKLRSGRFFEWNVWTIFTPRWPQELAFSWVKCNGELFLPHRGLGFRWLSTLNCHFFGGFLHLTGKNGGIVLFTQRHHKNHGTASENFFCANGCSSHLGHI
jgi:hypothetical protein